MTAKDNVKHAIAEHKAVMSKYPATMANHKEGSKRPRLRNLGELLEVQESQNALLDAIVEYLDLKV